MRQINKIGIPIVLMFLIFSFTKCKTQNVDQKIPFRISEKVYFYWVGGRKGSSGTTIIIKGVQETTNLYFPNIYFQNHKYDLKNELNDDGFTLTANVSELVKAGLKMDADPAGEYGNTPPVTKKIPFDLAQNEAVLVYAISGKNYYHKITGIKQLETVKYP
ncbi:hypothetical protein MNBD_BACTEROID05-1234 [hydrothermal vent metagenome]|uniref:Uncharacterized protein n=1 Tax=hydrothermal vent metagenome TaxID=652676 RepID=A0A3B0TE70_9ZZZZ